MFTQTSLVTSVGSGAGALRSGMAANQTGNLLGTDTLVISPFVPVGTKNNPGGVQKKRFGVVGKSASIFDYPELAVKVAGGNGQAYKASKAGYLPGNGGGGTAGFGCHDPHDYDFNEAADLTEAKAIAMRQADYHGHFPGAEHAMYHDKTEADMRERLMMMGEDYRRDHIRKLKAAGLTDEEIAKRLAAERERMVMSAEKMPYSKAALLEAQLANMLPIYDREDYPNQSVAPGAIARRQDATAYERAINVGNPVANLRKMAAQRQQQKIRGEISVVEPMVTERVQESIDDMVRRISKEMDTRRSEKLQAAYRSRQASYKQRVGAQEHAIGVKLMQEQEMRKV